MATILIPTPLRKFTGNLASVETQAQTVEDSIVALTDQYPDLKAQILDSTGKIRSFVRLYLGEDDIYELQGPGTAVSEQSVISIIPAIAGGLFS
ncbi:MoaD/ThiS family protein [Pontibacter sp. G13]|uniref:MoaD/ThiS family protein n=1 Tax=Pontibacter sp. G13 TaxID=3074898 RepID=UPI00288C6302|nr:MoaD/ThiS family protein [Pontibacter sp. G13]WNJ18825.1 MoaD/ThiS family protein [Pontibacter sp. G13]